MPNCWRASFSLSLAILIALCYIGSWANIDIGYWANWKWVHGESIAVGRGAAGAAAGSIYRLLMATGDASDGNGDGAWGPIRAARWGMMA